MYKKNNIKLFLTEYPLYKSFQIIENYVRTEEGYTDPYSFHGETFTYFCERENDQRTFEIEIPKHSHDFWASQGGSSVPDEVINNNGKLNYTQHFIGICKSCKEYHIDLILHIWSDIVIPTDKTATYRKDESSGEYKPVDEFAEKANIFIEKIGLLPARKVSLDKDIIKFFDRETENWYFKALKCLNDNLGIASFAYFRRIIEKELLKIVSEISKLESADSNIKKLLEEYNSKNSISSIYEYIFNLLPSSLKSLGINPIQTLYKQTSEGLHSLSEKDCLDRAESIDTLLKFVVKKIYEEKSDILIVKEAIKKLNQ